MDKYIKADALIAKAEHEAKGMSDMPNFDTYVSWLVDKTPAEDVLPVVIGHWEHDDTGANYCSECGQYIYDDGEYHLIYHTNYCPHCGAKMDRPEDEDGEDDYDPCEDCRAVGNDYSYDENGDSINLCEGCPMNEFFDDEDV